MKMALCAAVIVALAGPAAAQDPGLTELRNQAAESPSLENLEKFRQAVAELESAEARYRQWKTLAEGYDVYDANEAYPFAVAQREALANLETYDHRYWPTLTGLLSHYVARLGWPGEAVDLLREHLDDAPVGKGDPLAWTWLADVESQVGNRDEASHIVEVLSLTARSEHSELAQRLRVIQGFVEDETKDQAGFKQNLEASQLIQQFRARLNEEEWAEADEVLVRILDSYPDILIESPERPGHGPRETLAAIIEGLPPSSRMAYGRMLERSAEDVIARGDATLLRRFDFTHPWLPVRGKVQMAAGYALLRQQRYRLALRYYESAHGLLAEKPDQQHVERYAARAAALAGDPLPDYVDPAREVTVAGKAMALAETVEQWRRPAATSATGNIGTSPLGDLKETTLRLHQAPLSLYKWHAGAQNGFFENGPNMLDYFVPYYPAGDRDAVFVNTSEMLYAVDPVEKSLIWARRPSQLFTADLLPPSLEEIQLRYVPKQFYVGLSPESVFYRFSWSERESGKMHSALYASRREDGTLLWSTENIPELNGLRFISDPTWSDGVVVAGAWEPRDIPVFYLVGLDAVTGELLYKTWLYSGTMFPMLQWGNSRNMLDVPLGVPPPLVHEGSVFFGPSTGYMARIDLVNGQVEWIRSYPRRTAYGPSEWAGEFYFNRPVAPPMVSNNTLLFAPRDFRGLFFMDPATGKIRRQYESTGFRSLIGSDDQRAYMQEDGAVAALNLSDASVAWRRVIPERFIVGRPTLSERGILCSTNNGHYQLDPGTGEIVNVQPRITWRNNGNALDLGDRLVTVSINSLTIYDREGGPPENWHLPQSPAEMPLQAKVPDPGGLLQWTLPAPDRNDFYLSHLYPGLMAIRNLETIELRRTGLSPNLLTVHPDLQWPRYVRFSEETLVVDYNDGQIAGIDVETGRQLWRHQDDAMQGVRSQGGTFVYEGNVVWFGPSDVRIIQAGTGETKWERTYGGIVKGIVPDDDRVAVFVQTDEQCRVILYEWAGEEIEAIRLTEPGEANISVLCARQPGEWIVAAEPVFLLSNGNAGWVDLQTGELYKQKTDVLSPWGTLYLQGGVLYVIANDGLQGAISYPELKPIKFQERALSYFDGDIQYYTDDDYYVAKDLTTGDWIWDVRMPEWRNQAFIKSGRWLLAAQTEKVARDEKPQRNRFIVMDSETGEVVHEVPGLGKGFNKAYGLNGHIYASDGGYLYRFGPPEEPASNAVSIQQEKADPMAVAALKIARDQEAGTLPAPPLSAVSPVLDGDLSEWRDAAWTELRWPQDWVPDPVLSVADRRCFPSGDKDLRVRVALAREGASSFLAVEVEDDRHDTSPHRPLWRGDSVELLWRGTGQQGGELHLTLGCVDGVPVVEQGPPASPERFRTSTDSWPAWLKSLPDQGEPGWFRAYRDEASSLESVDFIARRVADRTIYEIAMPAGMLESVAPQGGELLWSFRVNDADGHDREGALEWGSASLQYQRLLGYVDWPAREAGAQP